MRSFVHDQRCANKPLIVLWGVECVRARNFRHSDFCVQSVGTLRKFYENSKQPIRISKLTDMGGIVERDDEKSNKWPRRWRKLGGRRQPGQDCREQHHNVQVRFQIPIKLLVH